MGVTAKLPAVAPAVGKPIPLHWVAFVLDQVSVLVPPFAIVPGLAVKVPMTAPVTVTVAPTTSVAPPAPTQLSE